MLGAMAVDPLIGFTSEGLRFDRLLGRGGMGAVYAGWQLRLDRPVAIKVIAAHLTADQDYRARFIREAQCLGRLRHQHIMACYDHGPVPGPGGDPLLVMVLEQASGGSLAERLRSPARVVEVLAWFEQAAAGLAFAHRQGVLHRDIKPDNLMFTEDGVLKLGDFGLARAIDSEQVTATGAILGSPAYMAPEACRGEEPSASADLYSLGCSLFQALTGQPPYLGSGALQVLQAHQRQPVPRLEDFRPDLVVLAPVLARCLAKRPVDRQADLGEFAKALRAARAVIPEHVEAARSRRPSGGRARATVITGAHSATQTLATRVRPPLRRAWPWVAAGGLGLLVIAGGLTMRLGAPATVAVTPPTTAQADNINALLDKAELLLAERRNAAAAAALDTLPLWVHSEDLSAAQRARLQTLQARLDQGDGISAEEIDLGDRLDRLERLLIAGDATGAVELLDRLPIPARLVAPEERRSHLLARAQAQVPDSLDGRVQVLSPVTLAPCRLADLPAAAPWTTTPIGTFPLVDGTHRLRLDLRGTGEVMVYLGTEEPVVVTVLARMAGVERRLMSLPVDGWTAHLIPMPEAEVEALVFEAGAPVAFAAAVQGQDRVPTVADLPLVPGGFTPAREPRGLVRSPARPSKVGVLWPEPLRSPELDAVVSRGLGLEGPPMVLGYALKDRDVGPRLRALAGEVSVLVLGLPMVLAPGERFAEVLKRARDVAVAGAQPILVLGIERGRLALTAGDQRAAWQKALAQVRSLPVLIDLGRIPAFYARHQQPLDPGAPAYGEALERGLEIGLRQWADIQARQASTSTRGGAR